MHKIGNSIKSILNAGTIITAIIMIVIIGVIYYISKIFYPKEIIPYEGYGVTGKAVTENLLNNSYKNEDGNETLVKIEEQEMIFKRKNTYYVGSSQNSAININYPIFINGQNALYNLSESNTLITNEFEAINSYPRYTLTDGILYNEGDLERADINTYLFIKNEDNIFINQKQINIETENNKYTIPKNSIIHFDDDIITYYVVKNEELIYNRINDIDGNSNIEVDENKIYKYGQFLINLALRETVKEKSNKRDEKKEEEIKEPEKEDEKEEEKNTEKENDGNKNQDEKPTTEEPEEIYVKPDVICTDFEANVYSARSILNINDPVGKIVSPITFELRKNGKIYLRKAFLSSGNIEIMGLEPESKYTITGSYTFLNEDGKQIKKEFFNQEIETKGRDILEPIELYFENGEIFSKKIQIKDIKIVSSLSAEALKGLRRLEVNVGSASYKIPTSKINQLLSGTTIIQETQENLTTNDKIKYEFKAYDLQGNELIINNNSGETRTAKAKPSVIAKVRAQDVSEVELSLDLKNKDDAKIENYRYELYDASETLIKEGVLKENQKTLKFTDLNPNQFFITNIYCDYDINDGNGVTENQIIGICNFTSVPISTLGYLHINTQIKEITKNNIVLELNIDEETTDSRLIYITQELNISILEKINNDEDNITIKNENLEKLKNGEHIEVTFDGLKSNTEYMLNMTSKAKQGDVEENVDVIKNVSNFITNKIPAEVLIRNQMVTGDMIDFDIKIVDNDNAVLNNMIRMEMRDEQNKLIEMQYINTNQEYTRVTFEKLEQRNIYNINFYADEYNEGSTDATYNANYLLKTLELFTQPGISGSIGLIDLKRGATGRNLIDVKSEVKWYSNCFGVTTYYDKTYDEKTDELRIYAGKNGYGQWYVYDLKEYAGQTITFSFLAKRDSNSDEMKVYLQNAKTAKNRTEIQGITEEWQRFTYTVTLDSSGYIGLYVLSANNTYDQALLLKEVQGEVGNRRTEYKKFEYTLEGNIEVNLEDRRDEIQGKDYYISIEENGELKATEHYIEIDDLGKVSNSIKKYNFTEGKNYRISLIVIVRERAYTVATTEFTTQNGEILGIKNKDDFLLIQPNGNYIVLGDIDLSDATGSTCRFGCSYFGVRGKIDFQGHKLIRTSKQNQEGVFYYIERTGSIENIVYDLYMNHAVEYGYFRGLVTNNRGRISNLILNLKQCNELGNVATGLVGVNNYGTLENFVINLEVPLYGARQLTGGFINNYGTIKNGYIYGNNIEAHFSIGSGQERYIGGINCYNARGTVENVYSLINVNTLEQSEVIERSANVVYYNYRGLVQNTYSVGKGSTRDYNYGPTVGYHDSARNYNCYYFTDETFTNDYNLKTTKLALYDVNFQSILLNGANQFIVDELVSQNYYPHIKMSGFMPNQEYISLPKVEDKDLIDILSYEIIEDNTSSVKLQLSINNPSGERITNIRVKDISALILSQEYQDGKTTMVVELSNPLQYVSKYSIMSITSQGALNLPFTRNYEVDERNIYIDMYKAINSIEDWKNINQSPTENYRLMTDLDFLNCEKEIIITNRYTGIIDGAGHTIKNIRIPKDATNYGLFYQLDGQIKNLYVENFNKDEPKGGSRLGFISYAYSNTIIDNVHIKNERLTCSITNGTALIGGLIADGSNLVIKNSSVTGLYVNVSGTLNNARAGGLVGNGNNIRIENCYVQNLDMNIKGALIYYGFGGIIGRDANGSIKYCYSTGTITADAEDIGGIYGFSSGTAENCYSLINIKSQSDYAGGIGGYDNNTSTVSTYHNLYLGNLYSSKQSDYVNRIIGNLTTEEENYAYNMQKINGFNIKNELGATRLLTNSEIFSESTYTQILDFGDEFSYNGLSQGILPKLYNTNGTDLLPNQLDNKLEQEEIYIEEVEAEKADVNTANVRVVVSNPSALPINGLEIEYANVQITANVHENGKNYIDLIVTPERAYDSYTINKIIYEKNGQEEILNTEGKLDIQFYKEINSFEDWQRIDNESAQNYRLNVDIDFTGRTNVQADVSIGRLEAEKSGHTLKNIEITVKGTSKGLIKEIKNSLKNIYFENITVNNTATSNNNYTGVIVRNLGSLENIKFKNITINAPKMNYVGTISNNSSLSIENVQLENITISGVQYVGGFIAKTDSGIFKDITIDGANITANNFVNASNGNVTTAIYAGGVIGKIDSREPYRVSDITANNVNITGVNRVGAILGQGRAQYFTANNCNVTGVGYVGGLVGIIDYNDTDNRYLVCKNSTITGTGTYIGGIAGQSSQIYDAFSIDNNVIGQGVNATYVGGLAGNLSNDIRQSGAINTTIRSEGKGAGGIAGYFASSELYFTFVQNCKVQAEQNAGGLVGEHRSGIIAYNYANAEVRATNNSAGGLVGYLNNKDMTGANYTSRIYQCYVAGSNIVSTAQVGGLIGRTYGALYNEMFYYSNYVEAYLNSNATTVSMGVGSDKTQNNKIARFFVYDGSTINGEIVDSNSDNIKAENLLSLDRIKTASTYRGSTGYNITTNNLGFSSSYYDFSKISNNKYPLVKYSGEIVKYQDGIDFPDGTNRSNKTLLTLSRKSVNNNLPIPQIYCVGANLINIEFKDTGNNLYLYYTPENEDQKELKINKKVYTFKYDFNKQVKLEISNGISSKEYIIQPSEVSNKISLINDTTYYLKDEDLYAKNEKMQEKFVNLYKNEALSKNGKIYDIKNKTWNDEITQGFILLENAVPLETSNYNGITIETYSNYTVLKNDDEEITKEGKILVRNNSLSIIDSDIELSVNCEIINKYNGNEYQTILGKDKKLYDLKTPLNYPEDFSNEIIVSIAENDSENPYITVVYEDGGIVTFNYLTGEKVFDNDEKEKISLIDYLKNAFTSTVEKQSIIENSEEEYEKSEQLKEKLKQNPIENVLKQLGNSNSVPLENETITQNESYITAYNSKTKEYVVYKESELLNMEKQDYESETSKISQNIELSKYYRSQSEIVKQTNGLAWVIPTLVAAIIGLIILIGINITRKKNKK